MYFVCVYFFFSFLFCDIYSSLVPDTRQLLFYASYHNGHRSDPEYKGRLNLDTSTERSLYLFTLRVVVATYPVHQFFFY